MTATSGVTPRSKALPSIRAVWPTAVVAAGAIGASLLIAYGNQPFYELLDGWIKPQGQVARGALYSSFLLLIGGPLVIWRPATFGFQVGRAIERWPLVIGAVGGMATLTAVVLSISPPTPYGDSPWLNEVLIVPFTEELVFRAMLLTLLLWVLRRMHQPPTASTLAIGINAIAFGMAHVANGLWMAPTFVAAQMVYATLIGVVAATLMLKTRSVYPAMLVHAAVNAVVVAF